MKILILLIMSFSSFPCECSSFPAPEAFYQPIQPSPSIENLRNANTLELNPAEFFYCEKGGGKHKIRGTQDRYKREKGSQKPPPNQNRPNTNREP